jgi:hypothetical protein
VHGKWQHTLLVEVEKLGRKLDGIFFDTWEETVEELFPLLPKILRPNGRFSFCNMYQPHDSIRHAAYSLYLATRLVAIGFTCEFRPVNNPGAVSERREDGDGIWSDVRYQYWTHDAYLLPLCTLAAFPMPPSVREEARVWASGDGRPANMLLWNAKFWYCQSLCNEGSDLTRSLSRNAPWRGESGDDDEAAGRRTVSLRALWSRHCDAERTELQAALAIEADTAGGEVGEDCAQAALDNEEGRRKRCRGGEGPALADPASAAAPLPRGSAA